MEYSVEITPIDDQIPLFPQTENDELEEGRKVNLTIEMKKKLRSQPKKSINEMLEDLDNSSIRSFTIFRVNVGLRESNPDAYTPKMVSIGPYHKENGQLRPMEKYKLLYLQRFLKRREGLDVESCISELEKLKEEALKCYDDIENPGNDQFLKMLLLDGCFVVEFIRDVNDQRLENRIIKTDCCIDDLIRRDLMLLENQLPFFVLNKLYQITIQAGNESEFAKLAKGIFPLNLPESTPDAENIKHLLHLIHMSWYGYPDINPECPDIYPGSYCRILCCNWFLLTCSNGKPKDKDTKALPNATELSEAGVSFMKIGNICKLSDNDIGDKRLFDIKFENGVIKIPCLPVVDNIESYLRNLIAFEQQSDVHQRYFSDFAVIMDLLIESDKDVNLLRQKGIIDNYLGEDKEVTRIFNQIGKGVTVSHDFSKRDGYKKAIQHCKIPYNRLKASLKHNYFSSLWVGTSTVAAILLVILTIMQTVLAFIGN